jgi:hypothetical protein
MGAFAAVVFLLGLAGISTGDVAGGVFSLVGAALFLRALKSSDVTVYESEVRTRSVARTRHLPMSTLRRVDVAVGAPGLVPYRREYLVFRTANGQVFAFKEFNAPVPEVADRTPVRDAANLINSRLHSTD